MICTMFSFRTSLTTNSWTILLSALTAASNATFYNCYSPIALLQYQLCSKSLPLPVSWFSVANLRKSGQFSIGTYSWNGNFKLCYLNLLRNRSCPSGSQTKYTASSVHYYFFPLGSYVDPPGAYFHLTWIINPQGTMVSHWNFIL